MLNIALHSSMVKSRCLFLKEKNYLDFTNGWKQIFLTELHTRIICKVINTCIDIHKRIRHSYNPHWPCRQLYRVFCAQGENRAGWGWGLDVRVQGHRHWSLGGTHIQPHQLGHITLSASANRWWRVLFYIFSSSTWNTSRLEGNLIMWHHRGNRVWYFEGNFKTFRWFRISHFIPISTKTQLLHVLVFSL